MNKMKIVPNFAASRNTSAPMWPSSAGFLFVGRLSPEKGLFELLSIWPRTVELRIAGSGPEEARCRVAAREKNVVFLGSLSESELAEQMQSARALIFPSTCREGGIPGVYTEALSHGLPVVARTGNAVARDVSENDTGAIFADAASLGISLEVIQKNHRRFSRKAKLRWSREFTEDAWVKRMSEVYGQALRSGTRTELFR
jgi:glycosyltransferase involved in cell wall biosynthesis